MTPLPVQLGEVQKMELEIGTAPRWAVDLHQQLLRGRNVILHGNLSDEFLFAGSEYITVNQFLERYFMEEQFSVVGRFDVVDGFEWADHDHMQPVVQRILDGALRGNLGDAPPSAAASAPASVPPMNSGAASGPARKPSETIGMRAAAGSSGGNFPGTLRRREIDDGPVLSPARTAAVQSPVRRGAREVPPPDRALRMVRTLLSQSRDPAAIWLNFTDRLFSDPKRQSSAELPLVILIKKILEEAALIQFGSLAHRRNVLVLLANQLDGIPEWLYVNNPLVTLITVTRPTQDERAMFFTRCASQFHEAQNLTQEQLVELSREFCDLTDGLTSRDLHALQRTSLLEKLPLTRVKKLVDRFRFARKDNPWEQLYGERIKTAKETLRRRVIGQEAALDAVEQMLISARVGLSLTPAARGAKPKGVFFMVGPTGVGKTELAKGLSELIFSDEGAYARFDMSEYAMEHSSEKLTGSPPGFVGYGEGGQLTNRLLERPFSLLLFDEIEKAHPRIMDKFLQVLEDGRLTDSRGQTADFSQSLIVFTSNIGSDSIMEQLQHASGKQLPTYDEIQQHYHQAVKDYFSLPTPRGLGRPELLNRFGDNILVFDILRPQFVELIARKFLNAVVDSTRERHGIELQLPMDEICEGIRMKMSSDLRSLRMGGRQVRTEVENLVLRPISRFLFENDHQRKQIVSVRWDPVGQTVVVAG